MNRLHDCMGRKGHRNYKIFMVLWRIHCIVKFVTENLPVLSNCNVRDLSYARCIVHATICVALIYRPHLQVFHDCALPSLVIIGLAWNSIYTLVVISSQRFLASFDHFQIQDGWRGRRYTPLSFSLRILLICNEASLYAWYDNVENAIYSIFTIIFFRIFQITHRVLCIGGVQEFTFKSAKTCDCSVCRRGWIMSG